MRCGHVRHPRSNTLATLQQHSSNTVATRTYGDVRHPRAHDSALVQIQAYERRVAEEDPLHDLGALRFGHLR